jgi:hypothetical protein
MLAIDFNKITPAPVGDKPVPAVVAPRPANRLDEQKHLSRLRLERIEALNRAMQVDNELYRSERQTFLDSLQAAEKTY